MNNNDDDNEVTPEQQAQIDAGTFPMSQENAIEDSAEPRTAQGEPAPETVGDIDQTTPKNFEKFDVYAFAKREKVDKALGVVVVHQMLTIGGRVFQQVRLKSGRLGWQPISALDNGRTHEKWCQDKHVGRWFVTRTDKKGQPI